jgi:uncharacterized protein (TIGR03067 family)
MKDWLLAIVLAFTPALTGPALAQQEAIAQVQGTWTITTMNGQALPTEPPITLTITGRTYQQAQGSVVNERGTIQIDPSKTSTAVDFFITDGPAAGMTQRGIIEVSGDTLRLSLDMPGANQRPTDFTAKEGVIVLLANKTTP